MPDTFGSLKPQHFDRLATFITAYSGIKLPRSKATMLEGRLRRRVRERGHTTFDQYCEFLFNAGGLGGEATYLIDAVTTNKTEFFREPEHFRFLAEHIVPEFSDGRQTRARAKLKIWSAACSIGAEPYTIAMVMADLAAQRSDLRYEIFATDICTEVLRTAQLGIYPAAMAQPIPPALQTRYVRQAKDRARQLIRIVPRLRAQVKFARLNLIEPPYPLDRDMDVIFCRNILIYFEKPRQFEVLRNLSDHLRPAGYLVLGHSESIAGLDLPLEPVGRNIFRRV